MCIWCIGRVVSWFHGASKGIEISQRSIEAINKIVAPTNKTELQSLIGKVNFIRRFISNLSGKIRTFSPLLKLKADQEFVWGKEQQLALDEIKNYLVNPPVLIPPQQGKPFRFVEGISKGYPHRCT